MHYLSVPLIKRWLRQLDISVSKGLLKKKLLSHPNYPSLLSLVDTLEDLNIETAALEVEKHKMGELSLPFLAHLRSSNGGEFVIIEANQNLEKQTPGFFERWDGVVILAKKTAGWNHPENDNWLKKEKKNQKLISLGISLFGLFIIASIFVQMQWEQAGLLFIAVAGILTSWMIITTELGLENKIADHICGKELNCDAVINSKGSRMLLGISWSDVGIIWFSFLLMSLTINSFAKTGLYLYPLLSLLTLCSVPFILFSLYYQWHIVKQWCRLCLITIILLLVQLIITLPFLQRINVGTFDSKNLMLQALLLFFVSSVWFGIKSILKRNRELVPESFANRRFKHDIEVFTALLQKQMKIDSSPFENDLQLGNSNSDVQIIVACNPYCAPCGRAEKILQELAIKNDIGLTIRFSVRTDNKEDKKLRAAEYLLQVASGKQNGYKRKLLSDWYRKMDLDEFKKQYPLSSSVEIESQLKEHEEWSSRSDILFTPTIFVNGHQLPKQYVAEDLKLVIKDLLESFENGSIKDSQVLNELI